MSNGTCSSLQESCYFIPHGLVILKRLMPSSRCLSALFLLCSLVESTTSSPRLSRQPTRILLEGSCLCGGLFCVLVWFHICCRRRLARIHKNGIKMCIRDRHLVQELRWHLGCLCPLHWSAWVQALTLLLIQLVLAGSRWCLPGSNRLLASAWPGPSISARLNSFGLCLDAFQILQTKYV